MGAKFILDDFKQSTIGSFIAVVIFFAIRGGNPFFFNPIIGMIITGILLIIYFNGFRMKNKKTHFFINFIIAFAISSIMGLIFRLITFEELLSLKILGSLVIIGTWVAFPSALVFDRFNFTNPLKRFFVRGRG